MQKVSSSKSYGSVSNKEKSRATALKGSFSLAIDHTFRPHFSWGGANSKFGIAKSVVKNHMPSGSAYWGIAQIEKYVCSTPTTGIQKSPGNLGSRGFLYSRCANAKCVRRHPWMAFLPFRRSAGNRAREPPPTLRTTDCYSL